VPTHKVLFAVAVLVLGVSMNDVQASTYSECWNSCGPAYQDTCGWMRKRRKRIRCQKRLLSQCQYWGVNAVCPAPPPTTTTTPTLPPTTVPPPPTTTTTLPPLAVPDLRGSYELNGTITQDTCGRSIGIGLREQMPFAVTTQNGTALGGSVGTNPRAASGEFYDEGDFVGSWFITASFCEGGGACWKAGVAVEPGDLHGAVALGVIRTDYPDGTVCVIAIEGTIYVY
jgi:hypothetical protein